MQKIEPKNVCLGSEFDDNGNYPLKKRRKKLDTPKVLISDVADMNDFAGTMSDLELKQKMAEHLLREVFI